MSVVNEGDGATPHEPLTPLYNPSSPPAPSGAPAGGEAKPPARPPRPGPLGARLSQRSRASDPPAISAPPSYPTGAAPTYPPAVTDAGAGQGVIEDYTPLSHQSANFGRVTGLLRLDDKVTGALHTDLPFGANWSSRSEMLRACLDEYYRLVGSYNQARDLLEQSGGDIESLRNEQAAAALRLREVESRLEFHSRIELRTVYLGAAELEARLFRAEEERDLLRSRAELLEGFMTFLSRIIATVRAIPPNVVINTAGEDGASGGPNGRGEANQPASASQDETRLYNDGPQLPATPAGAPDTLDAAGAGLADEVFILDASEAALLATSEFEILGYVEDVELGAAPDAAPGENPSQLSDETARGASAPPGSEGK